MEHQAVCFFSGAASFKLTQRRGCIFVASGCHRDNVHQRHAMVLLQERGHAVPRYHVAVAMHLCMVMW